jgi:Protein of unknown function (DUF2795)
MELETTMERGSDKMSPRQDDALKHDTEGVIRGGGQTHAEEWKGSEPVGEDQPNVSLSPDAPLGGGTNGMSAADVEGRAELASYIGRADYPVLREQLLGLATDRNAPDRVIDEIRRLPGGRTFENIQDVWVTLGHDVEQQRF